MALGVENRNFLKDFCSEPVMSFDDLNNWKPIEMDFHIGPRIFLPVNITKTTANCANMVICV